MKIKKINFQTLDFEKLVFCAALLLEVFTPWDMNTDASGRPLLHMPRLPLTAETQIAGQLVWKPCFSKIINKWIVMMVTHLPPSFDNVVVYQRYIHVLRLEKWKNERICPFWLTFLIDSKYLYTEKKICSGIIAQMWSSICMTIPTIIWHIISYGVLKMCAF